MSTHDDSQPTRADALDEAFPTFPLSSADRARFWAGLNRFLESVDDDGEARSQEPAPVLRRTAERHD